MAMNLQAPDIRELKPRITVFGVGGAGGNAVNNMIEAGLDGVDFVCANTDAQALALSRSSRIIQMGLQVTEGLGAGSQPEVGRAAAEEVIDEIRDHLAGAHMVFITAGMGGGTGTGAAPAIARVARDMGILTVGVVTKPFQFEGQRRMRMAEAGINELNEAVDTLIVIPNQNLFRVANETTGFADAFGMADQVLYSGVACITDLMVRPGLINLDFADVRAVMRGMGKAMMGTGEAQGEKRALTAAQAAINNPLLDDISMKGARGLLISITGGRDMKLYEVDEAATRIREEVDSEANIIVGATFDESLEGTVRVSVVATGIDKPILQQGEVDETEARIAQVAERLKQEARLRSTAPAPQAMRAAPQPVPAIETSRMMPAAEPAPAAQVTQDIRIEPMQPRPAMAAAPLAPEPAPVHEQPLHMEESFIPPMPERAVRPTRMPRIEDLPAPGQAQLHAQRGAQPVPQAPTAEQKRMSLMQRLASVGFGRKEDEEAAQPAPAPAQLRQAPAVPQAAAPSAAHAEYMRRPAPQPAPRPAQGQLDPHGRMAPVRNSEDDHLEIPAFLRRQAN
ncbi:MULTISPECIES: cell division protein FtsZ [unclassified Bosea (in: a-proteobacteria)]|uniref:cell division protein FtsZ n=1 Tax=unclassified Bosea (in: a-proteobacteria) TaxID=2653178 RepID=UPI0009545F04|nr:MULTISPECIES: cell division protein FtsZ [unclassified Bosea (in: a-proteobacteria)]TAJ26731.1 MAG: cell division protein FtsZ [Bosea sp. (in: a-proteobacteria)]SIQ26921.1 cell division protein FtsZ [Bosea sp. TND4EK4]